MNINDMGPDELRLAVQELRRYVGGCGYLIDENKRLQAERRQLKAILAEFIDPANCLDTPLDRVRLTPDFGGLACGKEVTVGLIRKAAEAAGGDDE